MKNLYVCEKCGSHYEDYDQAYQCENSHFMLDFDSMSRELEEYVEYGRNKEIPTNLIVPSQEICKWNEDKQDYDRRRVFGEYKLVRILPEKEVTSIIKAYEERREREKREWDEWYARREAERKAKAEAEQEQKEAE